MSDAGPAAVRRHLLRPVPWLVATIVLSVVLLLADVLGERESARKFRDALRLEGRVAASYEGGALVPIEYDNPLTEQRVEAEAYVWRADLPEAGDVVAIEVSRDDPGDVALEGDRFTVRENLPYSVMWPAIPLVALAARWWGMQKSRQLLDRTTSFVMLGVLTPPWKLGRSCHLHLFALDAEVGAPPVCVVPVLTTAGFPVPSGSFEVDVKGVPRPAGRVVARAGPHVFWPASRALLSSRIGRPAAIEAPVPVEFRPRERPALPPRVRAPWVLALPEFIACGITAVVLVGVVASTLAGRSAADDAAARSTRTVVEVVEADSGGYHVVVEFRDPGTGEERRANAPVDWPEDHPVGRRYPALVSPDGVRLVREPYDAEEPIAWGVLPFGVTLLFVGRRLLRMRANARTLRSGPFASAMAWRVPGGMHGRVGVGAPGRGLRAVASVGNVAFPNGLDVVVAGDAIPGAPIAFVIGGRPVVPAGPASSPPWPPLVTDVRVPAVATRRSYRGLLATLRWCLVCCWAGSAAALFVAGGVYELTRWSVWWLILVGAAVGVLVGLRVRVVDDGDALVVYNPLRTVRVPWAAIDVVDVSGRTRMPLGTTLRAVVRARGRVTRVGAVLLWTGRFGSSEANEGAGTLCGWAAERNVPCER